MSLPTKKGRRGLYPETTPYRTGYLRVSDLHEIYFEESGNPQGKPVVYLHGGPGSGCDASQRRFFDPTKYRIVLCDQRGAGRSRPHAELRENTTWHLIADLEALRVHLGIERWMVCGGSWGSTLGLLYAQNHPERVTELVLRGIFLFTRQELEWFYGTGTRMLFPDAWAAFEGAIPEEERDNLVAAYYRRLTSADEQVRRLAAQAWCRWEGSTGRLLPDQELLDVITEERMALSLSRIETHYFQHRGFLEGWTDALDHIDKIRQIPGVIIHGRYDVVCPAASAWRLHQQWPASNLCIVADAGHTALEPGIIHELVEATDAFSAATS